MDRCVGQFRSSGTPQIRQTAFVSETNWQYTPPAWSGIEIRSCRRFRHGSTGEQCLVGPRQQNTCGHVGSNLDSQRWSHDHQLFGRFVGATLRALQHLPVSEWSARQRRSTHVGCQHEVNIHRSEMEAAEPF